MRAQQTFPENAIRKEVVEAATVIGTELKAVQSSDVYKIFMVVLASLMTDAEVVLYVNVMNKSSELPYPEGMHIIDAGL